MHERGAPAVGRAAPDAGELVSARGRARAAHGAAPPRSAAASMGSPGPGPPPPRSARSRSVRYRADERPRIRVLPDVDFPVTQPRELQTQQQGAAEHAVRPPVDDDLLLLPVHSTPFRDWLAESRHHTVNQAAAGTSSVGTRTAVGGPAPHAH